MSILAQTLPNLEIDVETPWPLKRDGKQVYAKLLDFGGFPMPYAWQMITHNVPDIEWKQISWDHSYIAKSSDGQKVNLGLVSTPTLLGGGTMPWRFMVDHNSIQVNMLNSTDYREWDTVVLCLLYTKTGDGAESGSLIAPGPDGMVLTSRDNELVWEEAGSGCECEIAAPDKNGLVPEGGLPGELYGVNEEGTAYVHAAPEDFGLVRSVSADINLYVSVNGDDDNDGLTPDTPLRSIQTALDRSLKYRAGKPGLWFNVNVAAGTYVETVNTVAAHGASGFKLRVAGSGKTATVIENPNGNTVRLTASSLTIQNLALKFSTYGIYAEKAQLKADNVKFISTASGATAILLICSYCSIKDMEATGTYNWVIQAQRQSDCIMEGAHIVNASFNFFAVVHICSDLSVSATVNSFSGSSTGKRFRVYNNAVIYNFQGNENFLPGNAAGVQQNGGIYAA